MDVDEVIRQESARLTAETHDRMLWGDDNEQRRFAEWQTQQPDDDDIHDGAWHVEVNSLTSERGHIRRLQEHAGSGMWRKVVEYNSFTYPILRGVFYPLRPEDV